jgi:patatin-like phospholipase/acyl hydrolase
MSDPFYKILSIDGGGIRGLIAGLILVEIEKRTGKAISELFDLIAGTSTGVYWHSVLPCQMKKRVKPNILPKKLANCIKKEVI